MEKSNHIHYAQELLGWDQKTPSEITRCRESKRPRKTSFRLHE